jgi:hypothetical protein
MAEVPGLTVRITFDTSGITAGVAQATAGLKKVSAEAKTTGLSFGRIKETMLGVFGGNLLTQGIIGVERTLESMKEAVIQNQAAMQRLDVAMTNTKGMTDAGRESILKNIEAYDNLGFTSIQTSAAYGTLLTATGNVTQANKIMASAADLARYKHIDLNTAATILARGTQGSARAFKELGITLDTTIPKNKAIAKAFDELNARIGGQAKAYMNTFAGQMDYLRAKFEAVSVAVGKVLIPIFSFLAKIVASVVGWIQQNADALKIFAGVVGAVTVALKGWAAIQAILNAELFANPLTLWIAAGVALAVVFVKLWNTFKGFREAVSTGLATIVAAFGYLIGTVATLIKWLSYIPGMKGLRSVADEADKAAKSVGNLANSVEALGKKKITAPKMPSLPTGSTKAGGKTGITGGLGAAGDVMPGGGSTTVQYVTVYASNTNDIAKQLSKAAVNGTPIGGK